MERPGGGTPFERARVSDAMHQGVLACPPEASLRIVARMMAHHRTLTLVVLGDAKRHEEQRSWGVVSDLDFVRALRRGTRELAGDIAASPLVTVAPDDSLEAAVQLMDQHAVSHIVVVDPTTEHPVGILSTLGVASLVGLGEQPSPAE